MLKEKLKILFQLMPIHIYNPYVKRCFRYLYDYSVMGINAVNAICFFAFWSVKERKEFYKKLKSYGICNIVPFHVLSWKHKICYFTGDLKERKVFIKTCGVVNTIKRENNAIQFIRNHSEYLCEHVVKAYSFGEKIIVEEMISGETLEDLQIKTDILQNSIISQLFKIYIELKRIGVVHLDIRPQNLMLSKEGTIYIIDFGFALVNTCDLYDGIEKTKIIMDRIKPLGGNYAPKNGTLDDAYSMLLTLKFICPELINKYPDIWEKLNYDIGTRVIKF